MPQESSLHNVHLGWSGETLPAAVYCFTTFQGTPKDLIHFSPLRPVKFCLLPKSQGHTALPGLRSCRERFNVKEMAIQQWTPEYNSGAVPATVPIRSPLFIVPFLFSSPSLPSPFLSSPFLLLPFPLFSLLFFSSFRF